MKSQFVLIALFTIGCSVSLRDRPVSTLRVGVVDVEQVCPGSRVPIAVIATLADGEQLVTEGPGGGDVRWSDFQVRIEGGHPDGDGFVRVEADPRVTAQSGLVRVQALSVHHTLPATELTIPVVYTCALVRSFRGAQGGPGVSGSDGSDGSDGSPGTQSTSPSAGDDGRDGHAGGPAEAGDDAPDVLVSVSVVRLARSPAPLLAVEISSGARHELHYVDPFQGSLSIDVRGGSGGRGGEGGDGGDGGDGGSPRGTGASADGGDGADAGDGGDGGEGGAGGRVVLLVAPDVGDLLRAIEIHVQGGSGGVPGAGGRSGAGGSGRSSGRTGRAGEPGNPGAEGLPGRIERR